MNKNFESIKHIDEEGIEYWTARELAIELGYTKWENFEKVLNKAKRTCLNSGQDITNHFPDIRKMVKIGSKTIRGVIDYRLSRYACYLIAQNGDPSKLEISQAQTYFAIQTRKQEIHQSLSESKKRIAIRNDVKDKNKKLFSTTRLAGVSNFGKFNDAGYKGLYDMSLNEIENKKKIPKGELLDYAGSEELGANLFRITQTEAKIKRENIKGNTEAEITHFDIAKKVRQTIKEIGGDMPENLKPQRHIREIKKEVRFLTKKSNNIKNLKNKNKE